MQLLHPLTLANGVSDGQLLDAFLDHRLETAFRALVDRHGPMVLGVCRRILGDAHDAEDAFQATFLVLARKAATVVPRECVANWLHGVAYRTAHKARVTRARADALQRRAGERAVSEPTVDTETLWNDLQPVLDEELQRLPENYRLAVVLCDLEGQSRKDAARQLGWPEGTLSGRLARARKQLAERLTRRGVTLSVAGLATALANASAAVPAALTADVARAACLCAGGVLPAGVVSASVAALTEGMMKTLLIAKLRVGVAVLAAVALMAGGGVVAHRVVADTPPPAVQNVPRIVDAELHVIGVYSAQELGKPGPVAVEVKPTAKPVVLVLTSYFPVEWRVSVADGARVAKVLLSGYHPQTVTGLPAGVPVVNRSSEPGKLGGWVWASEANTPRCRAMLRLLNEDTGLPAATYQGANTGTAFVVDGTFGREHGQTRIAPPPAADPLPADLLAAAAGADLHVVGVYGPDEASRPIDVEVTATAQPVVLVLTAYLDTIWRVKCAPGVRLKAVVASGYFPQEVDGVPAGVPVFRHSPDAVSHYFGAGRPPAKRDRFYAYGRDTIEYRKMVETLNAISGRMVSTFQGKYAGKSFVVDGKLGRDALQTERKVREPLPPEPTRVALWDAAKGAELHAVGIYWAAAGKNGGPVDVEVRATDKPVVLAVSSYMSALWRIKLAPGAKLKAVVVAGYFEQEFEGVPDGVPVVYRAWEPGRRDGYFYGYDPTKPEYAKQAGRLKELTGLALTTFQGAYAGRAFIVDGTVGRDPRQVDDPPPAKKPEPKEDPLADVADVPSLEQKAGGDADKRYFLLGPKKDAAEPKAGYGIAVILPGGDGSADFNPFVRRIVKNALPDGFIAAQPVAKKWTPEQQIVWPTATNRVDTMKFATEEFIAAIVEDVAKAHKLDRSRVFTLSWSSSGPAAYAAALGGKSGVTGSLVAMSVFVPTTLPPLTGSKGQPFYIYHSRQDRVCPFRMAEQARDQLSAHGAKVRFATYEGGHGWRGNLYDDLRTGFEWLDANRNNDR